MIKKWSQFNEGHVPSADDKDCSVIKLDKEGMDSFSKEPVLGKLISDEKVSLFNNEVWFFKNDNQTITILDQYFPHADIKPALGHDEENESVVNESKVDDLKKKRKSKFEELVNISKKIKQLESEHDSKMKEIHSLEDKIGKEEKKSKK